MLITCPKCGFSQPQDKYCANCGVDMESFKPTTPPVLKRVLGNPLLYIFLAFLLIASGVLYIRTQQKAELRIQTAYEQSLPAPVPPSSATIPRPTVQKANLPTSVPPQQPTPPPATTAARGAAPTYPPTDSRRENETFNVHIYYAEVDRATMDLFRQESLVTGQYTEFGDFKAGALPATRKPLRERGVRVLYKTEKKFDSRNANRPQQWFVGTRVSPEIEYGVSALMSLERGEENILRGEIEVQRSFRESMNPMDPPVKRSYPSTTFELTPGMSWMVTITLPTIPQLPQDEADGILRIFQSPQYKSRQTEFTLFFEFDTPAANPNAGKNSL